MALPRRAGAGIALALATLASVGCSTLLKPIKTPMPIGQYIDASANHETLLVFLPGIGDEARDFARQGFIAEVRRRGLAVDMITVDAHFGYYMSRTFVSRLHEDVFSLARRRGYQRIWLVGISLGGLGCFLYSEQYPKDVYGIIALAPYLGDQPLIDEIVHAGGPALWRPDRDTGDFRESLWGYLRGYRVAPDKMPRLILAYGTEDQFAPGQDLLAGQLPGTQVIKRPGLHRWRTWQELWRAALDKTSLSPPVPQWSASAESDRPRLGQEFDIARLPATFNETAVDRGE